jgi:hypothetical protein
MENIPMQLNKNQQKKVKFQLKKFTRVNGLIIQNMESENKTISDKVTITDIGKMEKKMGKE